MKPTDYSKDEIIKALVEANGVVAHAAKKLGLKREALRNWLFRNEDVNRLRLTLVGLKKVKESNQYKTKWEKTQGERLAIWNFFKDWTGWVIVIPDLHIPQTNWDKVQEMLEWVVKNTKPPRVAVLGGDNLNLDVFARFIDAERSFKESDDGLPLEIEQYKGFIDAIDNMFEYIVILKGNHDKRIEKAILRSMDSQQAKYIIDLIDIDRMVRDGNKRVFISPDWFVRIGDLSVSHYEKYSVIPGRVGVWVADTLKQRMPDLRAFIQAHVHRVSWLITKGVLAIEAGMLSKVPDYTRFKSFTASRYDMVSYGFACAYLRNGKTDFNLTRPIYLGGEDMWPIIK